MSTTTVGFVGTGIMGRSMAGHLLAAGNKLRVFSRTKEKAAGLIEAGAVWCASPAEAAAEADVVISIVGFPADVEEVYLGRGGILSTARARSVVIDMTTSSPALAIRIAGAAKEKSVAALDAPVSGGDIGAREARLSIMVGGDEAAFEKALPLFQAMGKNIVRQGPAGAGQHTKMCNQIAVAASMLGVCEALAYAKRTGLDQERVLASISSGAAGSWSLSNLAPRVIKSDFAPGFMVKHFRKDLGIALEAARECGLDLPMTALAAKLYARLAEDGGEELGTQALYRLYG
ncbi:MAG: NAD(P)-dependent oxidoreductase [Opitutaceae bacterium]